MKKYRFKTLEEFGGKRPFLWSPSMDKYLGQELILSDTKQREIDSLYGTNASFRYVASDGGNWSYLGTDLVEITDKSVNMERIHRENWQGRNVQTSIYGVEMQTGEKYYLLPNVDGCVPTKLNNHSNTEYIDSSDLLEVCEDVTLAGNKKVYLFSCIEDVLTWVRS